ncbi:uncharacterized protein [Haliotis cracherodii]|uniref:uncharacterized protein n=1 Tax=Haliotis cracherodii TaxID=6455 RepID=UPI0039ECEAEB
MPTLLFVFVLATFGTNSACGTCVADCDWSVGEWGECSRSCGGGNQTRNRTLCCHDNESTETCLDRCHNKSYAGAPDTHRMCNNVCFNGGTFDGNTGVCRCRQGWTSTCCQKVSSTYKYNCRPHAVQRTDVNVYTNYSYFDGSNITTQNAVYVVKTHMPRGMVDVNVGRNMSVGITFFTDTKQTSEGNVRHMAASFSSLLKETLIYRGLLFGNLTKISLEVAWRGGHFRIPEAIDVTSTNLVHPSAFRCVRKLSEMESLQRLVRKRRSGSRSLKIEIRTSSAWFSGTGAKVYVRLTGDKGVTGDMRMTGGFGKGDIARNTVSIDEIGVIQKLRIWHDNTGSRAGWNLDWVRVHELSESGVTYEFHCGCSLKGGNNAHERTHSTVCRSIDNCRTQRCHTCVECKTPPEKHYFKLSTDKHTCTLCPYLENCMKQECHECTTCNAPPATANYIYRMQKDKQRCYRSCVDMNGDIKHSLLWLRPDKEHCDATCSYVKDRWCWPGTCSDGLTKSCLCDAGFRRKGSAICDVDTKATLLTCNVGIEDIRGSMRNSTSIGNMTDCYSQTDVYINIQPEFMTFSITADFQQKVSSSPPVYLGRTYIGIVDSNVTVTRRNLSGTEHILSFTKLRGDGDCSKALSSSTPSALVSCDRVLNGSSSLQNGEWLCGRIKVYSGGSFEYKNFDGRILGNNRFNSLEESKTICFRYDNVSPVHCTKDSRFPCSSASPLRLSTRATKSPNITVGVSGWIDPYPESGKQEQASGVKYFKVEVYGMKLLGLDTLDVDYANRVFILDELKGNNVNISVSLPVEPAMYVTYLEVHDVAGNVRFARRFLLYDNSSKLEVMTTRVLRVISASVDSRYTWQIHHGNIQLDWNERYHNDHYVKNDYFCHMKPDTSNAISGVYDQVTGILPVMGTESIHGITSFKYQWCLNNGSNTSWESVPDFINQSLSLSLNLTDGETYEVWIEAQDIMLNTIAESVVVHIDRSVADIADTWLVRDGTSQIYVHNNTDLSTMVLQFRAWDVHSGITSVLWALGTINAASDLGNGALRVKKLNDQVDCPRGPDCYCPSVGPCEFQNYTLNLGSTSLKANNTNTGQHNREYYFTLFITNGAMLKSFAHLDVLVDESPPAVGVVQEGSFDGPDIDYTSEEHVLISWQGFIDHESGIRYYIVGLADRCLTLDELKQTNASHYVIQKATTESVSLVFPTEGRYFTSLVAVNNALEPSAVICSDGITFDLSPPIIENINLLQAASLSSLHCIGNHIWLINSNMTMAKLPMVSQCLERCHDYNTDRNLRFPIVHAGYINNETGDSLCRDLPYLNETVMYVPFHKLVLNWSITESESQIRDSFVGFGYDVSTYSKPDLADYKPTHGKTSFHSHETGFDSGTEFYIFIKTENKAGVSSVATLGPVMIDDTPPDVHGTLVPEIVGDHVRVTWTNHTFSDPEEVRQQFIVTYRAVIDEDYVTPILQSPSGASQMCKAEGHAGCIQYPLVPLQHQDSELGKTCLFELYVYNSAGHFTTVRTGSIRLPSLFPPGPAVVVDVDPSDVDSLIDVDFHQQYSACAHWSGFKHHRNVTFEIGLGSSAGMDDVVEFTGVTRLDTLTACINSSSLKLFARYFTSIRAKCSGGGTVSSSDGFMIVDDIPHSISVNDGPGCELNEEIWVNYLDLHNLSHHMIVNVTFDKPLHLGHHYSTVLRNITTFKGFTFLSDDVFTTGSNVVDNSTYQVQFFPLTTNPKFQLSVSNGSSLNIYMYRCVQDVDYMVSTTSYTLHWESNSKYMKLATHYHLELLERTCNNESSETCVNIIRATTVKAGRGIAHLINLNLKTGQHYLASVSPCFGHICLSSELSDGVMLSGIPDIGNIISLIQDDTGACTNISIEVASIECAATRKVSRSCIIQWAITKSESDISPATRWMPVDTASCDVKTSRCLKLPIHSFQKMFTCVRVFCPSGQFGSKCAELTLNPYAQSYSEHALFELPADDQRLANVEDILHSERLGTRLKLLHELDVDFINSSSRVSSIITNTAGRNITWFIMRGTHHVPVYDCDSDESCLAWKCTQTGYVRFGWIDFDDAESYYICANVSGNKEKELSTFTICGNGFVVDKTPPVGGSVSVINTVSGFITDSSHMSITWSGFSDKQPPGLGYAHAIKSYSIAIGNYPHGQNVKPWTQIGERMSFQAQGLSIKSGEVYYVTIKAEDHVGHITERISPEIVADLTPPVCGDIHVERLFPHKKFLRTKTLHIHWRNIHDPESGIDSFHLTIFTSVNTETSRLRFGSGTTSAHIPIDDTFIEGYVYEIRIQATNNAQLQSLCTSKAFIIDNSQPHAGVLRDGYDGIKDEVDFQTSTTELGCHWTGFDDPHSGIQGYRIGLGTSPGVLDVQPLLSVGLRTSYNWTHAFIPGVKYYSTVEACNNAGLCVTASSDGIVMDGSSPAAGVVIVGHTDTHNKYHGHRSYVHSKWVGFEDAETGIHHFECCIGQTLHSCDIMNFTNTALSDSYLASGLHLPLSVPLFVTVRAYNPVGLFVEAVSPSFEVDDTAPKAIDRPVFMSTAPDGPDNITIQWDNSLLYSKWKFTDDGSPIHRHILTFKTYHVAAVAVEQITLGPQTNHLLILQKDKRLRNGDKYQMSVTSCNRAGLCTTSHSNDILIDSTSPILGGFKPPLTWQTMSINASEVTFVNLTWYGFSDAESNISCYHINVGTSYEGGELTNDTITVNHDSSVKEQSSTIQLSQTLSGGEIVLSIWAENSAHLLSPVGKVTVSVVATNIKTRREGILELQRHSCDTHYCTDDCTCAVVGRKCNPPSTPVDCHDMSNSTSHRHLDVRIYPEAHNETGAYAIPSLSCIAGHWKTTFDIQRYEWSMGLLNEPFGAGIFTASESTWYDVGKRTEIIHCLPYGRALEHGEDYAIYIRAWYSDSEYRVFTSPSIRVDHTPPSVRRGRALKDSDSSCNRDFDIFNSNHSEITACWQGLFQEMQTNIKEYIVWAGVTKYGTDLLPYQSVGLTTDISLPVVNMTHGTKYYVGIRAINSLNMSATVISDGFVVDADIPVGGHVFNTEYHQSKLTQSDNSSFGVSWHGFQDHHSSVKQYHVHLKEDNSSETVANTTVTLRNSNVFDALNLEHGQYYTASVVAEDFAGHLSNEVTSLPVLIDATPPYGFVCKNFTNVSITNMSFEENNLPSGFLNVFTVALPRVTGSHYRVRVSIQHDHLNHEEALFSVGGIHIQIPFVLRYNHTLLCAEYQFTLDAETMHGSAVLEVTIQSKETFQDANIEMELCTDKERTQGSDVITTRQLTPSLLGICTRLMDPESGLKNIQIGVGTTPGGFQLQTLRRAEAGFHQLVEVTAPHGTPVYTTVIAENSAGLTTHYLSDPIVFDHTPPKISDVKVHLVYSGSQPSDTTHTSGSWSTEDDESGIAACWCALGYKRLTSDLHGWVTSTSGASCQIPVPHPSHGLRIYMTIQCTNNVELDTLVSSNELEILFRPPLSAGSMVDFVVRNSYSQHGKDVPQSVMSYIAFQWTWPDQESVNHYQCRVTGMEVWLDTTLRYCEISGVRLKDGENYTAMVRAVNKRKQVSEAVSASVTVDRSVPVLTGRKALVYWSSDSVMVTFGDVFYPRRDHLTYTINVGSSMGYSDYMHLYTTRHADVTVNVPGTTSEIHVTITAQAPVGTYETYYGTFTRKY